MSQSLKELAVKHGADKYGQTKPLLPGAPKEVRSQLAVGHQYAPHYDLHFSPFRHRPVTVLEIGVGGYADLNSGGESLRMWKEYFPNAQIVSLDYYDKSALEEDRIRIYQGSQDDPVLLKRMHDECGGFDIIIDDGSHCCEHVIASFNVLFPLMKQGGIYAIEDLQTSYWKVFGGSSTEMSTPTTSMGFLKGLVDGLNHVEFELPGYKPSYFDKHVTSMHFYHNLAFMYKGNNDEKSNAIVDNQMPAAFTKMARPEWMASSVEGHD